MSAKGLVFLSLAVLNSQEKYSDLGYNLACILTFPCVQRRGFGRFLIEFSYALSKKEEKFGSPEKPLSDLGALGYKSYWSATLVRVLRDKVLPNLTQFPTHITIADLTCLTSIQPEDVIATLMSLNLLIANPDKSQTHATSEPIAESSDQSAHSNPLGHEDSSAMDVVDDAREDNNDAPSSGQSNSVPVATSAVNATADVPMEWSLVLDAATLDELAQLFPEGITKVLKPAPLLALLTCMRRSTFNCLQTCLLTGS